MTTATASGATMESLLKEMRTRAEVLAERHPITIYTLATGLHYAQENLDEIEVDCLTHDQRQLACAVFVYNFVRSLLPRYAAAAEYEAEPTETVPLAAPSSPPPTPSRPMIIGEVTTRVDGVMVDQRAFAVYICNSHHQPCLTCASGFFAPHEHRCCLCG